jgi:S-adenosylmethionine:diacylglycerol 3-amino-3-carboxypropyl transferase
VFNLQEDDHVITIASAGCNVLDYIIEGARVTAVDFNACQIALTELKATAIKELNFDQFFSIFAKNNIKLLRCVRVGSLCVV